MLVAMRCKQCTSRAPLEIGGGDCLKPVLPCRVKPSAEHGTVSAARHGPEAKMLCCQFVGLSAGLKSAHSPSHLFPSSLADARSMLYLFLPQLPLPSHI
jgi:hypothetical protein